MSTYEIKLEEISFRDADPDLIKALILDLVSNNLGRQLYPGDPLRLFTLAFAAEDIQIRNYIDFKASQTLLAFAVGNALDYIGDTALVTRLQAVGATTRLRFSAGTAATSPITIPNGTRVTPDGEIFYATDWEAIIPVGQISVEVDATCLTTGTAGNGFITGEINQIVDPVPHVPNVVNISETIGGADPEDDDAYRERIRLSSARYSVAGPRDAYKYWAMSVSPAIGDVFVNSPNPGYVNVYVLLQGGSVPGQTLLNQVLAALNADDVRPLTDFVTVQAPTPYNYTVDVRYFINRDAEARATEIQEAVDQAVADWIVWQKSAIGRDLNPSELIKRIVSAGAKRVEVTSPIYTIIPDTTIAIATSTTIDYGGIEDG